MSPWYTDAGGDQNNEGPQDVYGSAGPRDYYCHGPTAGPFDAFQDSALAWARFEADSAGGQKNHFTGRALGSKADPLTLEGVGESVGSGVGNYPGVAGNGSEPEEVLTTSSSTSRRRPPISPSRTPSASRTVGFLGLPTWDMPRLQCGMPSAYAIEVEG